MGIWDFVRDSGGVRLLVDFGAINGVPEDRLLDKTELTHELICNPSAELSPAQELRVIENLLKALNYQPGKGLELGLTCNFSTFGMWGYGLICSATLGDAIDMALKYLQLTFAYSEIEQERGESEAKLNFAPPNLPAGIKRFVVERDMGAAVRLLNELAGKDFHLNSFELQSGVGRAHSKHDNLGKIGGVDPIYNSSRYSLSFDRKFLTRTLKDANSGTVAMCEQVCRQLLEKRRSKLSTSKLIETYIANVLLDTPPTLEVFSKLTNTSVRTIKRRLQREGTTFRALVADSRSFVASELVQNKGLHLTEIAERLGYSDLSSFSQAFKRWFGISPAEYRRRNKNSLRN